MLKGVAKMTQQEHPDLISDGHRKITTTYRVAVSENDLNINRKNFPTAKDIKKEPQ